MQNLLLALPLNYNLVICFEVFILWSTPRPYVCRIEQGFKKAA